MSGSASFRRIAGRDRQNIHRHRLLAWVLGEVAGNMPRCPAIRNVNLRNFPSMSQSRSNEKEFSHWNVTVNTLALCFVVQLGLAFGLAGLFWPDKFMPLFEILLFPWAASCRAIRANSIAAIGLSLLLLVALLTGNR